MKNRNKAIYALLYNLTNSDKDFTKLESDYLNHIAEALGLLSFEVEEIKLHPKSYELNPPHSEQERMTILYYMLFAMQADGEINKNEENTVYQAGLKLGFNESMLKDMISVMKNHLNEILPNDILIGIIKMYMN